MTSDRQPPTRIMDEDGEFAAMVGHATTRKERFAVLREYWDSHLEHLADDAAYWANRDGESPRRAVIRFIRDQHDRLHLTYLAPVEDVEPDDEWPDGWWIEVGEDHPSAVAYTALDR